MTKLTEAALAASNGRLAGAVAIYAAVLAIVLTAIGLYGTLTFTIHRRTKELGIRMALGATPQRVCRMVLQQGAKVIAAGTLAGLVLATGSTRLMAQMLYGPPAADPLFYGLAGMLVALTGVLACWAPARRAAALETTSALRIE
jgi:ABC-type antimicrobial peptide transport system permease subunit